MQPGTYVENINMGSGEITLASLFLTTGDTSYISQTIIDGNEDESVISILRLFGSINIRITGFTIQNGFANDNNWEPYCGGGIYYDKYFLALLIVSLLII